MKGRCHWCHSECEIELTGKCVACGRYQPGAKQLYQFNSVSRRNIDTETSIQSNTFAVKKINEEKINVEKPKQTGQSPNGKRSHHKIRREVVEGAKGTPA